ncbi:MAG TPA: enoyl-CoA hydratase/isomerase family protein [Actinomycetota bacterium]|nr:enoyl-CoA hydratase/isomerase family protein [Actinomycetota bacterium]
MAEFETLLYREEDGVAWVTLNRPDVLNAFNRAMQTELAGLWTDLRARDEVRCVVLTAAGDKAFCTGIDRNDIDPGIREGKQFDALGYEDPRHRLGPKTRGLWKPVVAAVNGMACGGAFYMLGEADIIIAAEEATFFDPHLTYGMAAVYEPLLMMPRMPFGELLRMTLLGAAERLSAQRAHQIGLVSDVVPLADLPKAAGEVAAVIASQPSPAVQATVRTLWAARELTIRQALELGNEFLNLGTNPDAVKEGQDAFSSGQRVEWKLR